MLSEPRRLTRNGTIMLNRLIRHDSIRLDSFHLASLNGHVPSLFSSVLGDVDCEEDV
jgi:hypothetical protein